MEACVVNILTSLPSTFSWCW